MSNSSQGNEPKNSQMGPHGLGDPNDRRLTKSEKNILIPQIRRRIVKEEKCANLIKEYEECVCEAGLFMGPIKCKEQKLEMADCVEFWNDCDEIQKRAREEYLQERAEYRRTGICSDNRKFMKEYLESKNSANMAS